MKKIALVCPLLILLFLNISGCVPLIVGGAAGALGARVISKDTIEGVTDKPYNSLWSSALKVSQARGTIQQEDSTKGIIELEVEKNRVTVKLIRLTRTTTKLRVSARNKFKLPNIDLAEDIFVKVMEEAR